MYSIGLTLKVKIIKIFIMPLKHFNIGPTDLLEGTSPEFEVDACLVGTSEIFECPFVQCLSGVNFGHLLVTICLWGWVGG